MGLGVSPQPPRPPSLQVFKKRECPHCPLGELASTNSPAVLATQSVPGAVLD